MRFSIIIPAYNEAKRLPSTLIDVMRFLEQQEFGSEVIVVDDGSTDDTVAVVEHLTHSHSNLRVLKLQENRGKGAAVRAGMIEAKGEFALFNDADGSTPIAQIVDLHARLENDSADIAIGSRALMSQEKNVQSRLGRKLVGRIFNFAINFLILPGIKDTQCGFKLFRKSAYTKIFPLQKIEGFSFDIELLYLARRFNFEVVEVPVDWHHVRGSKVNVVKDGIKMLLSALTIRSIHSRTDFSE